MSSSRFAKTYDDLAAITPRQKGGVGVSNKQAQKNCNAWGITKGEHGYDVAAYLLKCQQAKRHDLSGDGSLKDEKTLREIKLLDIEIDERMGRLKPMDEWNNELREIVALHRAGLDQWLQWIASELRSPSVYKKAKETVARLCDLMQEKASDATEKHD